LDLDRSLDLRLDLRSLNPSLGSKSIDTSLCLRSFGLSPIFRSLDLSLGLCSLSVSLGLRSFESCLRDLSSDLSLDLTFRGLSPDPCLALRSRVTCLSLLRLRCRLLLRLMRRRVCSSLSSPSTKRCLRLRGRSFSDALSDRRLGLSWCPVRLCSSSAKLMERFLVLLMLLLSYLDRLSAFGLRPISWDRGRPWL